MHDAARWCHAALSTGRAVVVPPRPPRSVPAAYHTRAGGRWGALCRVEPLVLLRSWCRRGRREIHGGRRCCLLSLLLSLLPSRLLHAKPLEPAHAARCILECATVECKRAGAVRALACKRKTHPCGRAGSTRLRLTRETPTGEYADEAASSAMSNIATRRAIAVDEARLMMRGRGGKARPLCPSVTSK